MEGGDASRAAVDLQEKNLETASRLAHQKATERAMLQILYLTAMACLGSACGSVEDWPPQGYRRRLWQRGGADEGEERRTQLNLCALGHQ
jgi:hypothetical protein